MFHLVLALTLETMLDLKTDLSYTHWSHLRVGVSLRLYGLSASQCQFRIWSSVKLS